MCLYFLPVTRPGYENLSPIFASPLRSFPLGFVSFWVLCSIASLQCAYFVAQPLLLLYLRCGSGAALSSHLWVSYHTCPVKRCVFPWNPLESVLCFSGNGPSGDLLLYANRHSSGLSRVSSFAFKFVLFYSLEWARTRNNGVRAQRDYDFYEFCKYTP